MIIEKPTYIYFDKRKNFTNALSCPSCDSRLKVRDSRLRKVIDSSGNTLVFSLPRLFCQQCKKLHILLPDIIKPFKSYSRLVIDNARAGQIMDCPADDSTIRRWRK